MKNRAKIEEIKNAIEQGFRVFWKNESYEVIGNRKEGHYVIKCHINDSCIGLHGMEGTECEYKLNGKPSDFIITATSAKI